VRRIGKSKEVEGRIVIVVSRLVHRREGIGVERAAVGWFFLLCLMCVLKARVQFDVSVSVVIIVTEELLEDVTTYMRERLVYKKERERDRNRSSREKDRG